MTSEIPAAIAEINMRTGEIHPGFRLGAGEPVKTLRDEMALAALTGMLAGFGALRAPAIYFAQDCYTIADAMLAARQKGGAV